MQLQQLKCSVCGANLQYNETAKHYFCEHCRSEFNVKIEIPASIVVQLNIAGNERENYAFSRARKAYEAIIEQDDTIVEAYWGLLLSKYGIEYVEDRRANCFVPTCHRASSISIFDDPIYAKLMFLEGADSEYIQKAKQIERIRQKIIDTATLESPYDIFICYKDKDGEGNPTQESLQANDLYHLLVDSGYKVFFARKSLDTLAGNQYEPVIYNALNTASIMFLFCSKIDYVESPWVKNEWGRFSELADSSNKKILVPILCGLDPNALPIELTRLQGLDISKVGFEGSIRELVTKTFGKANPDVKYCNSCLAQVPFSSKFCSECGCSAFSLTPQSAFNQTKDKAKTENEQKKDVFAKPKIIAQKIGGSITGAINKVSSSVASTFSQVFGDDDEEKAKERQKKEKEQHKKEKKRNDKIDPFIFENVDPFEAKTNGGEKGAPFEAKTNGGENGAPFEAKTNSGETVRIIKQRKPSCVKMLVFAILSAWFVLFYSALHASPNLWVFGVALIVMIVLFIESCCEYNKKIKIQKFVSCKERVTISLISSMLKSKKAIDETQKYIAKMIKNGELIGYRLDGNILVRN